MGNLEGNHIHCYIENKVLMYLEFFFCFCVSVFYLGRSLKDLLSFFDVINEAHPSNK